MKEKVHREIEHKKEEARNAAERQSAPILEEAAKLKRCRGSPMKRWTER